jgi:uncharacterized membrane protein/predicted DsbA family dithiol-disulfide isomerase
MASLPVSEAKPVVWRAQLAFALVGLGASAMSAYVHHKLLTEANYQSFCDVSSVVSCTQAYLSRFGTIRGVPVALAGVFWFGLVVLLLIAGKRGTRSLRENVAGYVFALSTLALAAVLYLGYASFFILNAVCLLCIVTYAAVIGVFLLSGAATSVPMASLPQRALRDVRTLISNPAALAIGAAFVVGSVLAVGLFPSDEGDAVAQEQTAPQAPIPTDERTEFERWYEALPKVQVPVPHEGAMVLIVKFNDYQCPPCRQSYLSYKSVLAKYHAEAGGAVKFVTKDFPLERECHAGLSRDIHPAACEAAVAVRLARQKGTAEKLEDWIFAHQPDLTPELIRQAAQVEAAVTRYDADYLKTLEAVKADVRLGQSLGVTSTPTFFINGRRIPEGALPAQYFDAAIAYEMRQARTSN